ncbi:cytochrome c biogenesis protein CcdA [Flavobacterium sp. MC2016-06]|uniref:protein-disulfide reductase DsbD family protein n=1 Tax=Flavobacterium sp. MC2016-06 TaxID=2676308 RepID=UPI0012BA88FF|nr:cytochrome c biogenesis protein CcdA [Flavobacterium sp. MC2016-06]MBU3862185.1 thioredoxin family protein [Flavobacterium sp. MC2016-06]
MKKLLLLFLILISYQTSFAQIYDPVSFTGSVKEIGENKYTLIITTKIDKGWHVYSQNVPKGGPAPTSFTFEASKKYKKIGAVIEPAGHEVDDPVFQMRIKYFADQAVFTQNIERKSGDAFKIKATIFFMVCNDNSCLPPSEKEVEFSFKKSAAPIQNNTEGAITEKDAATKDLDAVKESITKQETPNNTRQPVSKSVEDSLKTPKNTVVGNTVSNNDSNESLWTLFFFSFLGGLAALFTPCVFPMIPMTVSFFTKQSKNKAVGIRNAILYGFFIIVIYVILGSLVTAIFGADALNALATNVVFNIVFFLLLLVFALSFLGAFEIMLPSSWLTKVDQKSELGGIFGIFFMALALAVVSFSCTGPIVGTLLVQAASQAGIAPIVGMLGFSLAIALPFALFAAFPGWLNSMPKSGGWLNSVKVVLGFLELALAFKFLSNADLVLQLHLLEREVFLAIWIAIFLVLALYLFGKIQLSHDSPITHISVGRLSLGIIVLTFVIYMIPGLWGAPLQYISGFPPSKQYSESPNGFGNTTASNTEKNALPEGAESGPNGIPTFHDYNEGLAYAKKVNKPVMIDFTGYACVNCRKMEERVWPDAGVSAILNNEVVLISLYVDDKRELPKNEQVVSKITGKVLKYTGQKWSELQILKYKTNAQPYYVLMDHNENDLNKPSAYNPDIQSYHNWLKEGIANFKSTK